MANLSFSAPANPYLIVSSDASGNPNTTGHLLFSGVDIEATSDESNNLEDVVGIVGPDIQVYNSTFLSGSNEDFTMGYADGAIISGNQIVINHSDLGFGNCQNVIFENNKIYSQNVPGQGADGGSAGAGLGISRENNQFGPSAVSQDIYVGYNTFTNVGSVNQQVITIDGDGGAYVGPIASSSNTAVTLAYEPSWNWMGTTNPQASAIAII
jgi:hypothetical protein